MARSSIIAWIAASVLLAAGCGQGAGNTPSGPTEPTASPEGSGGRTTTVEQTASSGDGLGCRSGMGVGGFADYAPGAKGKKARPVELARRDFSKEIEGGDKVVPERGRSPGTVRVIRDGRVVAVIEYRRAGGGWLRDSYEACSGF